jgi:hypothetical protein
MPRNALVLCVLVATSLACKPRESHVRLDPATFVPKLTARMTDLVSEPEVTAGFDALIAAIGADPTLRTRGAALLTGMTADPATSAAMSAVMEQLQKSPGLQQAVAELMAANPGVSSDQIGDLAGKRIEATWSSQPINQAWMRTWNRMRVKLVIGPLPKAVEAGIATRVGRYFDDNDARWGARLIELNGGSPPSAERAVELYLDHAWTADRIRRFLRGLLANTALQHELIATLQQLLALPAVERELQTATKALLSDPAFQHAAVELMNLLLGASPAPAAVEQQLDALLLPAPVITTVNHMIAAILADPAVPKILVDAFNHLAADPKLTADLHDLIDGW